jgi:Family of unknown function (DUF5759)
MSLCKRLNIFELNRKINDKKSKENISYEKVLEKCHKKILKSTNDCNLRTLVELPEHIYGYPLYDLNNCIKYVMDNLQNDGFIIQYFFPKVLYISWDLDEINDNKNNDKVMKIKVNPKKKTLK